MPKIKKNQQEALRIEKSVKSYYLIKNQLIDGKCAEGEISKLQAAGKMICQLLNLIKAESEIDYSVLEDIKFIVKDYINEINHIDNSNQIDNTYNIDPIIQINHNNNYNI
jgi:hypothetical protein